MSSINTLRERIASYEDLADFKLMKRLPIIIIINGRSFHKTTSLLEKPFSMDFMELMCSTMIKLAQEVDGTVFSYSFNDEIILVVRNDQNLDTGAWYDNKIQKISSATASIATLEFNKIANKNNINLFGDAVFISNTFTVPNITEAINVLIAKQQQAFHTALSSACFYELVKKFKPEIVKSILANKDAAEKANILLHECDIDFNNYPLPFKHGTASYRVPRVVETVGGEEIRNKLTVNMELPIFTRDPDFLGNILKSGRDLFRYIQDK